MSRMLHSDPSEFVACVARQSGKSWWALTECCEAAIRTPNTSIKYAAGSQKSVRAIIEPLLRELLSTCPEDLLPTFNEQRGVWTWPNGSELTVAGVDSGHYENLRGTKAHLIVRDEAAFFPASDWDSIDAALGPQLLTTGGMSLLISTPPENPAHPFRQRFLAAMSAGRGVKRTLYEHPRLTDQERQRFIQREASARGMTAEEFKASTYFRREYLCEFVTEESRAAIPAWNEERHRALVVERKRPEYFDGYTSLDFGLGDPHFAVLGYLDFVRSTIVITHEWTRSQANTKVLADEVKALEAQVFGTDRFEGTLAGAKDWGADLPDLLKKAISDRAPRQPYLRVGDNDSLILADLIQLHGLAVLPTRKDNKALAVNELDMLIRAGRLEIHPRCTNLIRQLYTTVWNKARTDWERTGQDHGDGVDCFIAGTMIRTPTGERRIEDLDPGDEVMTTRGVRLVERCGLTHDSKPIWELVASNGSVLYGTATHPVMTNSGWVDLCNLTPNHILTEWNQKLFGGTVGGSRETQAQSSDNTGSIIVSRFGERLRTCTWRFGKASMGLFRRAFASIMSTATRSTMPRLTSPVFHLRSIPGFTPATRGEWRALLRRQPRRESKRLEHGTQAKQGSSGTENTPRMFGAISSTGRLFARFADAASGQNYPTPECAETSVTPRPAGGPVLTMSTSSVRSVALCSGRTSTQQKNTAPVRVESVRPTGQEASVYNLSVSGEHEYFANGILVHNCLCYFARNVRWHKDPRPPPPRDPYLGKPRQTEGHALRAAYGLKR